MTKFALAGLAALAVVGVASFFATKEIGTDQAIENAKEVTRLVGKGIVEPELPPGLIAGRPEALRRFDRVVRRRVLREPIERVKLWTAGGRLVYSDEPKLIGERYPLDEDDLVALRRGTVEAGVSDLSEPENRYERGHGELLEVYLGIEASSGKPLLFEAYQRFGTVASSGEDIWLAFAPALIVALIVLELAQVPLAASMARRLRKGHREREALLQKAIDASDRERRRIAAALHDGVVQRLAGLSYSLAAAGRDTANGNAAAATLRRGADETRQSVRELRSLLVEIYPPSLQRAGLEAALSDLLAPLAGEGMETNLELDGLEAVPPEVEAVLFRVAQEATRNAAAHAEAATVTLRGRRENGAAVLSVEDDGRGFETSDGAAPAAEGHMGLQLLRDLVEDAGGRLDLESRLGRGTTVRVEVPLA